MVDVFMGLIILYVDIRRPCLLKYLHSGSCRRVSGDLISRMARILAISMPSLKVFVLMLFFRRSVKQTPGRVHSTLPTTVFGVLGISGVTMVRLITIAFLSLPSQVESSSRQQMGQYWEVWLALCTEVDTSRIKYIQPIHHVRFNIEPFSCSA